MADNYKILAQTTAASEAVISETITEILSSSQILFTSSPNPEEYQTWYSINVYNYSGTLPSENDVYYIDHPIMEGIALVDIGSVDVFLPEVYIQFNPQVTEGTEGEANAAAIANYFATNPQTLRLIAISPAVNTGANQSNVVYTVPENTQASVSSISLVNTSATSESYFLGVVKAAEASTSLDENNFLTVSNAQTIIPARSIEPNQVDEIVGGITLSAGDQIRVYSESEDLIVQVYGVEIS